MFSRQLNKITRQTSSLLFNDTKKNAVMDFHKNRMYISNKKCKSKEVHKDNVTWGKAINKKCQSKWDKEAKKNKKAKFWSKLFGSSSTTQDDLPICMPVKCKDGNKTHLNVVDSNNKSCYNPIVLSSSYSSASACASAFFSSASSSSVFFSSASFFFCFLFF